MSRFRVAFDGEWQEDFDTLDEAVEWAQEVSQTGRLTFVAKRRRLFSWRLLAAFPEDRAEEATKLWNKMYASYYAGRVGGGPA